jgi:hypothetical protein
LIFHEGALNNSSLDLHYQNNKSEKYGGFCKADHCHKASVLEGHDLLFVHCVSSEPTLLVPMGYRVFSFECREIHISFLDSLQANVGNNICAFHFEYMHIELKS